MKCNHPSLHFTFHQYSLAILIIFVIFVIMIILNIDKLPKWQQPIVKNSVDIAEHYIRCKYGVDCFDLVTLKCSNTCRFAKYTPGYGHIRLDLKRNYIELYTMKSIGSYNKRINHCGLETSYICQLIHELTHFVQDIENRCFSEVETTKNELEYLKIIEGV